MPEKKKMKVKKGWLAVEVGLQEEDGRIERFVVPISYLHHPLFKNLLDKAQEVYGYHANGPLRLPCSVDDFLQIRWQIEKESDQNNDKQNHQHHRHRHYPYHYYVPLALSFQSC
ncbi:Auxin-responsive protein SAUR32, partial [Cucurbita argyrosperma subsp. sororia]